MPAHSYGLWGRQWTAEEIAELVAHHMDLDWHAVNCVAIALAESGGYEHATNLVDDDPDAMAYLSLDIGMWQVNTYWHPDLTIRNSYTPETQIVYVERLAKKKDEWGYDWDLWVTWKNGAAQDRLGEARNAVNHVRELQGNSPI